MREIQRPTILVLEPDQVDRDELMALLNGNGYDSLPVATIDHAGIFFRGGMSISGLIVSLDGFPRDKADLERVFQTIPPAVPLIVYGLDNPEAKEAAVHCLNNGAYDFLAKPLQKEELFAILERAVKRPGGNDGEDRDSIDAQNPVPGWMELTASSKLEQLRRMQRFSDALFSSTLPAEMCEDLKMAVEEMGRNAMEWGNRFDPDKRVQISYCLFKDRIVLKFADEGDGFNPDLVPNPTLDPKKTMLARQEAGKRPGGYGVFLIQQLMDEVVYNEKGNMVVMTKFLPLAEDGEEAPPSL